MNIFEVFGPFKIIPEKFKKANLITQKSIDNIWKDKKVSKLNLMDKKGVYVFATRASKGYVPWYVGQTKRTFKAECAHSSKIHIYNQVINEVKGTPVLFVVAQKGKIGRNNISIVKKVESALIKIAIAKNPELKNSQKTKKEDWQIKGVMHSDRGQPNVSSKEFKKMMGI